MPNPFAPKLPRAALVLADGTVFSGYSFGAAGLSAGEVVFNTSMTGYQEILSDPSYARQIITLTASQIGNTGANTEDMESVALHVDQEQDIEGSSNKFRYSGAFASAGAGGAGGSYLAPGIEMWDSNGRKFWAHNNQHDII